MIGNNKTNTDQIFYLSIFPFTGDVSIYFKRIFLYVFNSFQSVRVDYSKELLAEQHYAIAIMLLIICNLY